MKMFYSDIQVVFQEVPGEIAICFTITGCKIHCEGCHSPHLWKIGSGNELTNDVFLSTLLRYENLATSVLFMGGEWHSEELINKLKIAKKMNFKTCLYTGQDSVSEEITSQLTWLKTGSWIPELGGLNNVNTNQLFIEVKTNQVLNHLFIK